MKFLHNVISVVSLCTVILYIYLHAGPITVGYEFLTYTTSEGEGMVTLSIIIFEPDTGGAPRPFSLSVSTSDGSASKTGQISRVNAFPCLLFNIYSCPG